MPNDLGCIYCGKLFPHAVGAGLHCSDDCKKEQAAEIAEAVSMLQERGFTRVEKTPNLFVKDEVAISLEEIIDVGFQEAIETWERAQYFHAQRKAGS